MPPLTREGVVVQTILSPDEHEKYKQACRQHGSGGMSGQTRLLIRDWMRDLASTPTTAAPAAASEAV